MLWLLPLLTGGFCLGAVLADLSWLDVRSSFALGVSALLAGIRVASPAWRAAFAVALFAAAGGVALGVRLEESARSATRVRMDVTVEATVCGRAEGRSMVSVELCDARAVWEERDRPARVPSRLAWAMGRARPEAAWLAARLPGDRIRARLRVRPLGDARNPGERDRRRALERRGVGGRATLIDPLLRVRLPQRDRAGLSRWIASATRGLRARIARRLEAAGHGGALLAALAVGERRGLADSERAAFYSLGVGHLLAVSGLHLALAAGLAYGLTRGILLLVGSLCAGRDMRPLALWAALGCALAYAVLAGWGIPVRRSLVLLLSLAAALASRRVFSGSHALAAAALVIALVEPWAIFEPGAQLSFAASAALLFALGDEREAGEVGGLGRPRWRAIALAWRAVLRTSATAFLATAPIAVAHGGSASPVALFANVLMVPWTGLVLLPISLAGAVVAGLPASETARAALEIAAGVAGATLSGLEWAAAVAPRPGSGFPPAPWALMLGGGLALFALFRRSLLVRATLSIVLALWLRGAPPAPDGPGPPRVVALDVGLGDAVLVQGKRATVLVDGGWASPERGDRSSRCSSWCVAIARGSTRPTS